MKIQTYQEGVSLQRPLESGTEEQLRVVQQVLNEVKCKGDAALRKYTAMWDGVDLTSFAVTGDEITEAVASFDEQLYKDLEEAAQNIRTYHEQQKRGGYKLPLADGSYLAQRIIPLASVGLYVPGGSAAYPSSVLMNVIPAQVAGVKRIVITTPCSKEGKLPDAVLVAAHILGVTEIYKVGDADDSEFIDAETGEIVK